tara:strand:+ start:768 stop:1220 length:453 start_codon:yes stop_codon:yes gene_type:complete
MILKRISIIFCSGFGVGYFPIFPGTVASAVILPILWISKSYISVTTIFFLLTLYLITSLFLLKIALMNSKNKDPSYFVCDEYIGQAIPLLFCNEKILDYLIAFISFRILDIFKPFPINYFDKIKTEFGVVLDDIIAGSIVAVGFIYYYGL